MSQIRKIAFLSENGTPEMYRFSIGDKLTLITGEDVVLTAIGFQIAPEGVSVLCRWQDDRWDIKEKWIADCWLQLS